jgi:hypothetical protein
MDLKMPDDIEKQIVKAVPGWREEANDLVELAHNAERIAQHMDELTLISNRDRLA